MSRDIEIVGDDPNQEVGALRNEVEKHYATKADITKLENKFLWWLIGASGSVIILLLINIFMVILQMIVGSPSYSSEPQNM